MLYSIIIPARFESTRLPGKPLIELDGLPMIVRTYRQCVKACSAEFVHVATDSIKVRDECLRFGISVLMTSSKCLTGTDRVAECAQILQSDLFINVQGDEPLFNPDDIVKLIEAAEQFPDEIINGYCSITNESSYRSFSVPKVVFRPDGRLLYMSRGGIPSNKNNFFSFAWRQVGAYVFPRWALEKFSASSEKSKLEKSEDIEILRFLELGMEVRMIELSNSSISVDVPEDVDLALSAIRNSM